MASTYLGENAFGHPQFDSTRSEMGELLYRLKNKGEQAVVGKIISLLDPIKGIDTFDFIIPVPSSKNRPVQPADSIAQALGKKRGVPVLKHYLTKTDNAELKNVEDPAERAQILERSISITGTHDIASQKVLLLDDIYRSGATLNICCSLLKQQAKVAEVSVLTMTKTRSNR